MPRQSPAYGLLSTREQRRNAGGRRLSQSIRREPPMMRDRMNEQTSIYRHPAGSTEMITSRLRILAWGSQIDNTRKCIRIVFCILL
jgi:hypothetical protein